MVLANKWVLDDQPDFPILFLWLQILVAVLLLMVCHQMSWIRLPVRDCTTNNSRTLSGIWCFIPDIKPSYIKPLAPLIAVNVAGLTANTLTLKYLDASLYQVARSLILPFTVILQYTLLNQPSSLNTIMACGVVCIGFLSGIFGDGAPDETQGITFSGIFFGCFSSVTTALHAIVIKRSIEVVRGNTLELVWYNNVLSAAALIPVLIVNGEIFRITELFSNESSNTFLFGLLITGIFGFLINLAGFLQIKVTSPVSHMISSAFRGVLQTLLAVWFFDDILTGARIFGIVVIIAGSTWYTWIKNEESKSFKLYKESNLMQSRVMEEGSIKTAQAD